MEQLRGSLENLIAEADKLESALDDVAAKLDALVQKAITEELRERELKRLRYDIEDLEKEETKLEEQFAEKRIQIFKTRQQLRRKLLDAETATEEDKKSKSVALSMLLTSSKFSKRGSSGSPGATINRSNYPADAHGKSSDAQDGDPVDVTQWQVKPTELEYDRTKKLGSGAFGDVFRGKLRGKDVAIKKLVLQDFDENTLTEFKKEVAVMAKLRHPNTLLFMGACTSPGNLAMVMELMPRGSVYDLLHDEKTKLTFQARMLFAKDCALGMNWLHCSNPPFLHLDLKTQNLLVDENWTVKVADFGLTQIKKQAKTKGKAGSPIYMSPEMLLDQGYDEKSDVYSFGIVLWELLTQDEPYKGQFSGFEDLVEAVTKKAKRPDIPPECSPKLKQLIQSCWNPSPANRPPFQQILKSHVLDEIIVEGLISEPNALARELWKASFLELSSVPWQQFLLEFSKKLGFPIPKDPDDIQIECLKQLFTKKDRNNNVVVTLEDFGKMLEWFGPLEKGTGILRRMENQLRMKGFFGAIETQEAEQLLNGKKKGTYLLRFSTRDPGCYAFTVLSKQGVLKHYRVTHKPGTKYQLGTADYDSLEGIIKQHRKDLYLKTPLTGSRYETMFIAHDKKVASQGYMDTDFVHK